MLKKITLIFLTVLFTSVAFAQTAVVTGKMVDEINNPVAGAIVSLAGTTFTTTTDDSGSFTFQNVNYGDYTLQSTSGTTYSGKIKIDKPNIDLRALTTQRINEDTFNGDNFPSVSLSESELKDVSSQNVSSALSASRDAFTSATSFVFSAARFRIRGYDNDEGVTLMNGAPMEDLARGGTPFSAWSGLNDVMRNRDQILGLSPANFSFSGIAGASSLDSRASRQRKQLQVSYALSDRTYDNRFMLTYGSGLLTNGWSYCISYSRRWSDEGYVPGTFYDGNSYFGSVEKTLNSKHSLSLTGFLADTKNGRSGPATKEMTDLAGSHYYNPYWGYQNGKKRNASVGDNSVPVFILTHDWKINERSSLLSAVSFSSGKNKISGLDWYNAKDPRADYYRNLPSFMKYLYPDDAALASEQAAIISNLYRTNENARQINWDALYDANLHDDTANYILDNRVTDNKNFSFNTTYNKTLSDFVIFSGGLSYQNQSSNFYKEVEDLLGGKYYVDLNQYAELDNSTNPNVVQNDLNNPNRHLVEGDKYGYDYVAHISKTSGWGQAVMKYTKMDYFAALKLSSSSFYRTGNVRNGVFADNSYGDSKSQSFFDYALKGGATYKHNGRNYFFTNLSYQTEAPLFNDAYISPTTRNDVIDGLTNENIFSIEGGYLLRAPRFKARAVGYYTLFDDKTDTRRFYHDEYRTFVNYTLTGISETHSGVELAADAALGKGFGANAVAAIGQYFYSARPHATITQDNKDTLLAKNEIVYSENLRLGNGPQSAYTLGLSYRSPQYWFVYLNINYFDDIFIDYNPVRRTSAALDLVEQGSDKWNEILQQEKVKGQMTIDISAGYSWRLNNKFKSLKHPTYLVFNLGVSNIGNNTDLITGGFEQGRFDYGEFKDTQKFAPKYFYGYGTTFFLNLAYRMN